MRVFSLMAGLWTGRFGRSDKRCYKVLSRYIPLIVVGVADLGRRSRLRPATDTTHAPTTAGRHAAPGALGVLESIVMCRGYTPG